MAHVPLLDELAIIAALAVLVTVVLAKLRLPTVAGLLAAGALVGPFGLHLVKSVHAIEVLAEIGVVLLLFTIGLEFSLARLKDVFRQAAVGGILQVTLTIAATVGIAVGFGISIRKAIALGFIVALSSTAIVLRALSERRELEAPHGRFIVATLIFQDLCVVPMVLIIPLLGASGSPGAAAAGIGIAMAKAAGVVVATVAIARLVVPKVLALVDASRSREVFLLAILALCIGTAWLTSLAGLSLALGAFLAGMVVADTEFGHRALGDMLPLRDAFVSVFFVSLGMLFDARILAAQPVLVGGLLVAFLFGKGVMATLAAMAMRFPARVAWLAGVGLAQFGEFGFVLARLARDRGALDEKVAGPLFAAGVLSMFLTPLLVRAAPHITAGERLLRPLEKLIGVRSIDEADEGAHDLSGHVVIVGFGLAGRFAARALVDAGKRVVVLEINAANVRKGKEMGLPIYYGDATSEETLEHAHLRDASLLVLLLNDPRAAERILNTAHRVAPELPVLMRTRYLGERARLASMGASDVVAEEVEGAIEVISRVLRRLEVPRNLIDERIQHVRGETQTSERRHTVPRAGLADVRGLDELKIESAVVHEGCALAKASVKELRLRSETGALVVALRRAGHLVEKVDPDAPFERDDVVYLVGTEGEIERALPLFQAEPGVAPV
ncbi:MAG: cation:proton antiporter [Polyangiaceae bacterium]